MKKNKFQRKKKENKILKKQKIKPQMNKTIQSGQIMKKIFEIKLYIIVKNKLNFFFQIYKIIIFFLL